MCLKNDNNYLKNYFIHKKLFSIKINIFYYLLLMLTKLAVLEKYLTELKPDVLLSAACGFTISNP